MAESFWVYQFLTLLLVFWVSGLGLGMLYFESVLPYSKDNPSRFSHGMMGQNQEFWMAFKIFLMDILGYFLISFALLLMSVAGFTYLAEILGIIPVSDSEVKGIWILEFLNTYIWVGMALIVCIFLPLRVLWETEQKSWSTFIQTVVLFGAIGFLSFGMYELYLELRIPRE